MADGNSGLADAANSNTTEKGPMNAELSTSVGYKGDMGEKARTPMVYDDIPQAPDPSPFKGIK